MIEVADGNAAYYYHYDALGSVIALSDSTGDTVQTYEYSVFGEVAEMSGVAAGGGEFLQGLGGA